jgi:adenylate cyclase
MKAAKKKSLLRFRVLHGIIFINAFFIIISASIILTSMWINSEKNARELSSALFTEIQNSVSNRTSNYFTPARTTNQSLAFLLYRYYADPINDSESREKLFDYYTEILKIHPQFKMVYYADTQGDLVMLNRMADDSFSRRYVHNTGEEIRIRWDHANPGYYGNYPNTDEPAATGYDPRKRLWYTSAEADKVMIWTPVYLFATDHLPGFTCAVPIFDPSGQIAGVSSVDIAVDELSRFLGTIRPTPGTKIFIIDKASNLVALQAETEEELASLFTVNQDSSGYTTYNVSSISAFNDETVRHIFDQISPGKQELVTYKGKTYEAILAPVTIGDGLDLNIGVIIPEDDIVGNVRKNLIHVTIFSIVVLILILVVSSFLSQAIARPMRRLANEMLKIKNFDLDSEVEVDTNLLEILDMRESFEGMRSGLRNFKRYVPSDLVAQLISEKISADLGGEKRELTMFFSDIAKFTSIAEQVETEKLVMDLSIYFETVSKTILENKGTIDKYIGDSVMAFWGAPSRMEDHAARACRSAILIRDNLQNLFRQWENKGKLPFPTRMGIHTGEVIVGNMGYNDRLNYTVMGDSVNIASRLEGMNKVYGTGIIVSQYAMEQCREDFEFRHLDRVLVIGRKKEFDIYELLTFKDNIDKNLRKLASYYEAGLKLYFSQHWTEAIKYFSTVLKYRPSDSPSKLLRDRCIYHRDNPPSADWNGVFIQPYK